jgi:hypothetical protein
MYQKINDGAHGTVYVQLRRTTEVLTWENSTQDGGQRWNGWNRSQGGESVTEECYVSENQLRNPWQRLRSFTESDGAFA